MLYTKTILKDENNVSLLVKANSGMLERRLQASTM